MLGMSGCHARRRPLPVFPPRLHGSIASPVDRTVRSVLSGREVSRPLFFDWVFHPHHEWWATRPLFFDWVVVGMAGGPTRLRRGGIFCPIMKGGLAGAIQCLLTDPAASCGPPGRAQNLCSEVPTVRVYPWTLLAAAESEPILSHDTCATAINNSSIPTKKNGPSTARPT